MNLFQSVGKTELGRALASLRETRGLTRPALAKAAGLQPGRLLSYERGARKPSSKTLARLLAALDCPLAELEGMLSYLRSRAPDEPVTRAGASALAVQGLTRALEALVEARLASRLLRESSP